MERWRSMAPCTGNRRINPGLRHYSRLSTLPVPWKRPADSYDRMQMKRVCNHENVHPQLLILLNDSKNVISKQLPNMGSEYIARLVFDFNAVSTLLMHDGTVRGSICSRIFQCEGFIEIVFCAVESTLQGYGYGRLLMNYLKVVIQAMKIFDILTCADNEAVDYFKKQGFNDKVINMDPKRWVGRIKDYEGVTLMYCKVYREIDYLNLATIVERQIAATEKIVGKRALAGVFANDEQWIPFKQAPLFLNKPLPELIAMTDGVVRRQEEQDLVERYDERMLALKEKLLGIVRALIADDRFGSTFREPVTEEIAPGYFEQIHKPMDLQTIERRLLRYPDYYKRPEVLTVDINQMVQNCKNFNLQDTVYYKAAVDCWKKYKSLYQAAFPDQPFGP